MATEVILRGKIETTEKKAMELRSVVDGLITIAKRNDLASKKRVAGYLRNVSGKDGKSVLKILFEEVAPTYADRKGGYTRVTKTGIRKGDAAPLATIELV